MEFSSLSLDQHLWYSLTVELTRSAHIQSRPGRDWRRAYGTLEQAWLQSESESWNPFVFPRWVHDVLAIEVLLELGFDPAANDNEALIVACEDGSIESVRLLLSDDRVDPSADRLRALARLAGEGDLQTLRPLLVDPRTQAISSGNKEMVQALLAHPRVDPSLSNEHGETAINLAIEGHQTEILRLLLADTRIDTTEDVDPLWTARSRGYKDIEQLLRDDARIDAIWHSD